MSITITRPAGYRALCVSALLQGGDFATLAQQIQAARKAQGLECVSESALADHIRATRRWMLANGVDASTIAPISGLPAKAGGQKLSIEEAKSLLKPLKATAKAK